MIYDKWMKTISDAITQVKIYMKYFLDKIEYVEKFYLKTMNFVVNVTQIFAVTFAQTFKK
jgi:hypothetical protein